MSRLFLFQKQLKRYHSKNPVTVHALHIGLITPKTGSKLNKLSPADQQTIFKMIDFYKMGGSKQQKLVDYAIELTIRTGQNLDKIVEGWQQTHEEQENRPQQAVALLRRLEELCFPGKATAEKKFNRFRRSIQLPENANLHHTPSFEDDRLTLSIVFENQDTFRKGWDSIKKML